MPAPATPSATELLLAILHELKQLNTRLADTPRGGGPRPGVRTAVPASQPAPDAPVRGGPSGHTPAPSRAGTQGKPASEKQVAYLKSLAERKGLDDQGLLDYIKLTVNWAPRTIDKLPELSSYKASQVIKALEQEPDSNTHTPAPTDTDDGIPF
jgi:hypothetical protein